MSKKPTVGEIAKKVEAICLAPENEEPIVDDEVWAAANAFFEENGLNSTQIKSYNDFIYNSAHRTIDQLKRTVIEENGKRYVFELGELLFRPPTFTEKDDTSHKLYPVEALQRNITYGSEMYIDCAVTPPSGETSHYEKVPFGLMPVMVRSDLCNVYNILGDPEKLALHKEDFYDNGGYFVIAPKGENAPGSTAQRRVLVPQERAAQNRVFIFSKRKANPKYVLYAEVRSSTPTIAHTTTTTVGLLPSHTKTSFRISAVLPWIDSTEIPLGVLFKALGILDQEVLAQLVLGPDYQDDQEALNILVPSLEYSFEVQSQEEALLFIGRRGRKFSKESTLEDSAGDEENDNIAEGIDDADLEAMEALDALLNAKSEAAAASESKNKIDAINYAKHLLNVEFVPHVPLGTTLGTTLGTPLGTRSSLENPLFEKAKYLGYIVQKLLWVHLGRRKPDLRDHLMLKRIVAAGPLLSQQFYGAVRRLLMEITNNTRKALRNGNTVNILSWIKPSIITNAMQGAISGNNWSSGGPSAKGISQLYEQFNYACGIANMRKITMPMAAEGGKVIEPRDLHGSHYALVCAAETPEGKKAGLVKNLALSAYVTVGCDASAVRILLEKLLGDRAKENYPASLGWTRVFLNGAPIGATDVPVEFVKTCRRYRRSAMLYCETSIAHFDTYKEIHISTEGGRLCRPLFVVENGNLRFCMADVENLVAGEMTWSELLAAGSVELIDKAEEESAIIVTYPSDLQSTSLDVNVKITGPNGVEKTVAKKSLVTHCEIHPSFIYGIGGSLIPFSNHNQSPRNCYQCIWKEEPVLMGNGEWKKIKDVKIGDEVMSFDPETLVVSVTKVINHFVKPTEKKMVKLSCLLDGVFKTIVVTADHKILTYSGWQEAGTLEPRVSSIGMYLPGSFRKPIVFLILKSLEEVPNVEIADITTESENHSFIAGHGFCVHNSSMGKQAVGVPFTNYREIMSGSFHTMMYLQKPLALTRGASIVRFDEMPAGQNAIVAILPRPFNEEDSIEMNQDSIDRGFQVSYKHTCYYAEVREERHESFGIPTNENCERFRGNPAHLTAEGFPKPGTAVKDGDILIGKLVENQDDPLTTRRKRYTNASMIYEHMWPAVVDRIQVGTTGDGYNYIRVMVVQKRVPVVGDKFSFMHGQKGTIGKKERAVDFPFNRQGIAPDIIVNSLAFPSRMTIAMLLEALTGKAILSASVLHNIDLAKTARSIHDVVDGSTNHKAEIKNDIAEGRERRKNTTKPATLKSKLNQDFREMYSSKGDLIDATPFREFSLDVVRAEMKKYGCDCGDEILTDGITGKRIRTMVFFMVAHSQRLKHMVIDKMHARARGAVTTLFRQPVEGRAAGGGLRYGKHHIAVVNAKTNAFRARTTHLLVSITAGDTTKFRELLLRMT